MRRPSLELTRLQGVPVLIDDSAGKRVPLTAGGGNREGYKPSWNRKTVEMRFREDLQVMLTEVARCLDAKDEATR